MIIVKDEDSVEEAVVLTEREGVVHFSVHYEYRLLKNPAIVRAKSVAALERGEIALVASIDEELPSYDAVWPRVKKELAEERLRRTKEWARAHPNEVKAMKKRMGLDA